jgi:predicted ATP-grasp superfamily ATP-dependent carboligase
MYTGGLENHPRLVRKMTRLRELWGNDAAALELVRNPPYVATAVRAAGLACPAVLVGGQTPPHGLARADKRWLVKPLKGAAGRGIASWRGERMPTAGTKNYLQEFVEGDTAAAIFVGNAQSARLLGVTRQLVGSSFCHAAAFQYCGSVGPLEIGRELRAALERLGDALTAACQLKGLFGVDGVLRDDIFWPVEVNPRYTASVEVLERATGLQALAWHRAVFDATAPPPAPLRGATQIIGKGILMALRDVVFPSAGPWDSVLRENGQVDEMPAFADIPQPGERIKAGRPVMTLFARTESLGACVDELERKAVTLDRCLFGA